MATNSAPAKHVVATQSVGSAGAFLPPVMVERLETVLALLVGHHEVMLVHTREHREAIGRADSAAIGRCLQQQHADAARFAELERMRMDIFDAIAAQSAGQSAGPRTGRAPVVKPPTPTVSSLLSRIAEHQQVRIAAITTRLKSLVVQLEEQRRVIRIATESLLGHMQGLIMQVSRALSPTGTYSRPNSGGAGPQVISGLDLTS